MITLALIPIVVCVVVLVICLRARHGYTATVAKAVAGAESLRQEKLALDSENDARLIANGLAGKASLGDLVADYRQQRAGLVPDARSSDASEWKEDDLLRHCRNWRSGKIAFARRLTTLRASLAVLVVVSIGGGLAAWRYSALSGVSPPPAAPVLDEFDDDPFASPSK